MRSLKSIFKGSFVFCLLMIVLTGTVYAGNTSFTKYNMVNTQKNFNCVTTNTNHKIHAYEQWIVRVDSYSIKTTDLQKMNSNAALGIAYNPMDKTGSYTCGIREWIKTTGRKFGSWDESAGKGNVGYYHLGARLDDVLTGPSGHSGVWNSDSTD